MTVSKKDVEILTLLKKNIESLILKDKNKELFPIYEFFSTTLVKGKEKALNIITRYFYYDLKMNNLEKLGKEHLSTGIHSKLEEEAYLQFKEFGNIKENYINHGAIFPYFELSPEVFWSLAVKNIIKFIGYHHDNEFKVLD